MNNKVAEPKPAPGPKPIPVPKGRLLLLLGGGLGLLAGLNAALLRLGLPAPVESAPLSSLHGILMLYGFLGTAITLERAVALRSDKEAATWWGYLAPAASGLGVVTALVGAALPSAPFTRTIPAGMWMSAMGLLVAIYLVIWKRQQTFFMLIQILGAVAGFVGIALWGRGFDIPQIVPWWTAFLVLTILGERLELARIAFVSSVLQVRVFIESLVYFTALTVAMFATTWGYPLMGLALAVLVVDVGSHDVALRTIRTQGLTKFMAAAMLGGYAWALLAAGIWVVQGPVYWGYGYDTSVHALTIGFALSMVMAHAPIILPAVARREVPYSPVLWAVWGLLQAGLLVRVISGARVALGQEGAFGGWQFGGTVDVFTVLAFVITTVTLILLGSREARKQSRAKSEDTKVKTTAKTEQEAEGRTV